MHRGYENKGDGKTIKGSGRLDRNGTAVTDSTFFQQYGIDTTSQGIKRGMDQRSPNEEGQVKKQPFFGDDLKGDDTSVPSALHAETKGHSGSTMERVKQASANFRRLVKSRMKRRRKRSYEKRTVRQQPKQN